MIGIFDSGFGGLQTLKYFSELYPEYDYLFLADNKNIPYGEKNVEEIKKMTFLALDWMFRQGVKIVILACNTAASYSIRSWQLENPKKKVLSITIPGVEKIISCKCKLTGVLTTQATLESGIYHDLFARFGGNRYLQLVSVGARKLVPIIESGLYNNDFDREKLLREYLIKFSKNMDCLVLGCTHFPIWKSDFKKLFSGNIIDSGYESAIKFGSYLNKHLEIKNILTKNKTISFFVTGNKYKFIEIGEKIFGRKIVGVNKINL